METTPPLAEHWIDLRPRGGLLATFAHLNLNMRLVLAELIDNALDAGATQISITVAEYRRGQSPSIRVQDDGAGCENLFDMIRLAEHVGHGTTQLGRFGVGAKYAMLWLGGTESAVEITSICRGVHRRLAFAWREIVADDRWRLSRERTLTELPADPSDRGTTIIVRPCVRAFPEGKTLDQLVRDLGYLYSPALKRGANIVLRLQRRGLGPLPLPRWELPPLTDVVDSRIAVGERDARVYAGILQPGAPNPRPGLTYLHGFRVVKPSCGLGCGGMDHAAICGFVELDRRWHLTTNKDDISLHRDELAAAVLEVVRPLLLRAATRASELRLSAFAAEVESRLNTFLTLPDTKATRARRGEKTGTVETGSGASKHRRAARPQSGNSFPRPDGRLRLSYQDLDDSETLGHFADDRVILNTGNVFVAAQRRVQNLDALALTALVVFLEGVRAVEPLTKQGRFGFAATGDTARDLGKILAQAAAFDGRQLGATDGPLTAAS